MSNIWNIERKKKKAIRSHLTSLHLNSELNWIVGKISRKKHARTHTWPLYPYHGHNEWINQKQMITIRQVRTFNSWKWVPRTSNEYENDFFFVIRYTFKCVLSHPFECRIDLTSVCVHDDYDYVALSSQYATCFEITRCHTMTANIS